MHKLNSLTPGKTRDEKFHSFMAEHLEKGKLNFSLLRDAFFLDDKNKRIADILFVSGFDIDKLNHPKKK